MEEPLLGSRKRSSFYFNPALFQIPEEAPAEGITGPILPVSPSSIKERLIFGSPEASPRSQFIWVDYGRSSAQAAGEGEDPSTTCPGERSTCTWGSGFKEDDDSFQNRETEARSSDDTLVDYRGSGADGSRRKLLPALTVDTRLDFDYWGSGAGARSPGRRLLPSPVRTGFERGVFDGSTKPVQTAESRQTENQSHAVNLLQEVTSDYNPSKKKQLHRSRTAPAMTVMDERTQNAVDWKRPLPLESPISVVSQAFIGLMVYLAIGVVIYIWKENEFSGTATHGFIDALYFCIVTMCTIGYGDITPVTPVAKLFSCAFVLVGFGFIDILLSGMVTYVLDKQENLLLSAVMAGHHETAQNYLVDIKKGRMRIRSKVALAFGVVIMCIGVGTLVMHFLEDLGWLDAFYLSCMSVTTVGYGDHAFGTLAGRLFASIWLLVSTLAVARSFLYLAEARIDKRHRLIAKWVLQKEMTVGDLVAADLDNDGCVSKSDYVVYKLKEMGKIEEKDILEICKQFSRLDADNSGKITLSCLINHHDASSTH